MAKIIMGLFILGLLIMAILLFFIIFFAIALLIFSKKGRKGEIPTGNE